MYLPLLFKKVGNHWYIDIIHNNPTDICLDNRIERILEHLDYYKEGIITNIALMAQPVVVDQNGLIQFDDTDLTRFYTTDDKFTMALYISGHKFSISSSLYALLESQFKLNLAELAYKIVIT